MQLVAYGKRDVFITGMPQITFFRAIHHRHTPFVVQTIEQTFDVPTTTWGQTVSASLKRHGDLVCDLFLSVTVPEAGVPESDPSRVLGPFRTDDFAHDGTHFLDHRQQPLTEFAPIADTSFAYEETLEDVYARFDGRLVYLGRGHSWQYANSLVHRMLSACEIYIGTQRIDTQYGLFYEAWNELTVPEEQREGYGRMIGKLYDEETDGGRPLDTIAVRGAPGAWTLHRDLYERRGGSDGHMGHLGPVTYYLPLRFWFHGHPGLALPLCAVHPDLDVTVRVALAPWSEDLYLNRRVRVTTGLPDRAFGVRNRFAPIDVSLWADYVYLDDHERLRFANHTHEYLIPTLQYHDEHILLHADTSVRVPLAPFHHPIRELIWVLHRADAVNPFDFGEFADTEYLRSAWVSLGSEDVRDDQHRAASYFRQINPYYTHTRVPYRHVYCHPFALWPERATQPSGTVNASRLRYAYLSLRTNPSSKRPGTDAFVPDTDRSVPQPLGEGVVPDDTFRLHLFALGYDVLRIVPNTREVTLMFDRTTTTTTTIPQQS